MKPTGMAMTLALLGGLGASAPAQSLDQCKPIGYATRDGRSGGAVAVTGGGDATPIVVKTFADLEKYARDEFPRVIHIDGTLGNGWKGQSGDRLKITGKNKTIVGLRPGTRLNAVIRITEGASNIILRNIVIEGPGSDTNQGWDNLVITSEAPEVVGPKNIWVDHCEFWDGQDGNADVVLGSDNVTFTWNIFGYRKGGPHNLSNLIASGNSEPISEGRLNITYMFNRWTGAAQRQPRCRYGNVHVANNLLSHDPAIPRAPTDYGMAAGKDCRILAENNMFEGIQEPFSDQFKEGASGLVSNGNVFVGTTGNQTGWGTAFTPPYEYKSFLVEPAKAEEAIRRFAGATLASPTTCPPPTTSIHPDPASRAADRIVVDRRNLTVEGFDGEEVEVVVSSARGAIVARRRIASGAHPRSLDLSALNLSPGLHVASAISERSSTRSTIFLFPNTSRRTP